MDERLSTRARTDRLPRAASIVIEGPARDMDGRILSASEVARGDLRVTLSGVGEAMLVLTRGRDTEQYAVRDGGATVTPSLNIDAVGAVMWSQFDGYASADFGDLKITLEAEKWPSR